MLTVRDTGTQMESADPASTAYRWATVALLLAVSMLGYIDRLVFALVIDPMKADLHVSDTVAGALVGLAFTVSYALAGLPVGWLVDRGRSNIVLAVALTFWSLCTMLSGFARSAGLLFLTRCGVGIGESAVNPASMALISGAFRRDRVASALSVFAIGIYGGGGLAIVLGGQITAYIASLGPLAIGGQTFAVWRAVLTFVGIPGLILAPLVALCLRDRRQRSSHVDIRRPDRPAGPDWRHDVLPALIARRSVYLLMTGGLIAFSFYTYSIQGWFPTLLARNFGLTARQTAMWYGMPYLIGGVAGAASAGVIINRLQSRGVTDAPVRIFQWTTAVAIAPAVLGPIAHQPEIAIACAAAVIFLAALQHSSCFTAYVLTTPSSMIGIVFAAYVTIMNVTGGSLGSVIIGSLSDHVFGKYGLGQALSLMAAIVMPLAFILFSLLRPVFRRSIAEHEAESGRL